LAEFYGAETKKIVNLYLFDSWVLGQPAQQIKKAHDYSWTFLIFLFCCT